MKLRVDNPFLPVWALVAAGVVYLVAAAFFYWRIARVVPRRYWLFLVGGKLAAVAAIALVLLNPYWLEQETDKERLQVSVLIDATQSMRAADCEGESRIQTVKEQLLAAESVFAQKVLGQHPNLSFHLFAGDGLWRIGAGDGFDLLPGLTDIDGALGKLLEGVANPSGQGAVVLVSDGQDNRGAGLLEAAGAFRQAGIPIHCLGVGDRRAKKDLRVAWSATPETAVKGRAMTLTATVSRNFGGALSMTLKVHEGGREIASRQVEFGADERERRVEIAATSFNPGLRTYKVRVGALAGEEYVLNNIDLAGVRVKDPDLFRVLYFSANADWDYKFLNALATEQAHLQLDALVRLGESSWFVKGAEQDDEHPGFPEAEAINAYDCLIVELGSLHLLSAKGIETLSSFVGNRGGGIIFTGVADAVPPEIQALLPVKALGAPVAGRARARLELRPGSVLAPRRPAALRDLADRLYLPADVSLYPIEPEQVKPGALTVVQVKGTAYVALAAHNYGAGKVAFLNLPDTWKWVMAAESGERYYGAFWGRLISWSASSTKDRLSIRPAGAKLARGVPSEFFVDVLDEDFAAANTATLHAVVLMPPGDDRELSFLLDPRVDGRYAAKLVPPTTGELQLRVQARFETGESLNAVADYLVVDHGPETQPAPLAEAKLQGLARLTGGRYWHYSAWRKIRELPLAERADARSQRHNWLESWLFLALLLAGLLPDWALRRRIGLK